MTEKARSFRHKQVRMQGVLPGLRQQNRLTAAIHRAVARRLSAKTLAQPYVNSLFPLQTQSNPICMTPCPYKVICMKGRMQKCNSAAAAFCRSLGLHLSTAVFRGSATVPGTVFISYRAANHVYLNHKAHERARYAGACKVHMLKAATAQSRSRAFASTFGCIFHVRGMQLQLPESPSASSRPPSWKLLRSPAAGWTHGNVQEGKCPHDVSKVDLQTFRSSPRTMALWQARMLDRASL